MNKFKIMQPQRTQKNLPRAQRLSLRLLLYFAFSAVAVLWAVGMVPSAWAEEVKEELVIVSESIEIEEEGEVEEKGYVQPLYED